MDCSEVQTIVQRSGISPNKALGQHFLCDNQALARIMHAANVTNADHVLEVGPGLGVLTLALATRVAHVYAIEYDDALYNALSHEIQKQQLSNITLIQADILQYSLITFCETYGFSQHSYSVVSNLPYNISTRIIRIFLESPCAPASMTFLLQKEVALRASAAPGDMSMLSVIVSAYSTPRIAAFVPSTSFWPEPAVESAILHLDVHRTWKFVNSAHDLFRVAKIGFSARRKQLHNNLASGFGVTKNNIITAMQNVHIEPTRRAETLTCEEWDALATAFRRYL